MRSSGLITVRLRRAALVLTLLLAAIPAMAQPIPWLNCFDLASQRHQVPLGLLVAVGKIESDWDADARSLANAHGVMQIQWPGTAHHLGIRRVSELYNPCLNIDAGAAYLAELNARYGGDTQLALAAYNYGPGRVSSEKELPASVMRYVSRVLSYEERFTSTSPVPGLTKDPIITFASYRQAHSLLNALGKRLPGVAFGLDEHRGHWQISLKEAVDPGDRVRLKRILGALQ